MSKRSRSIKFFSTERGQIYLTKIKEGQDKLRSPNSILILERIFKKLLKKINIDYQAYIDQFFSSQPTIDRYQKLGNSIFEKFINSTKNFSEEKWDKCVYEMLVNNTIQFGQRYFIQHIINYITLYPKINNKKYIIKYKKNKSLNYEIKKLEEDKDIIPVDVIDKLFENADEFLQIVIAILITTGIRVGALSNIKKEDINYKKETIKIIEKGNKEELIKVNKKILYLMNDENFFNIHKHKNYINYRLKKLAKEQNILEKYIHPHAFRHTFATLLVKKNIDIHTVSKLLGHTNVNITTQYYVKESIADHQSHTELPFLKPIKEINEPKIWQWVKD